MKLRCLTNRAAVVESGNSMNGDRLVSVRMIFHAILLVAMVFIGAGQSRSTERTVSFAAVGDIFFCRGVSHVIEENGVDYLFESTTDIISSYDLAFCNLECALSNRGTPLEKRFLFRSDPSCAYALSAAGFDIVCLGNNHSIDYGYDALLDTMDAVENAGMTDVGTQVAGSGDSGVRIIEKNGLTIGFLAFCDLYDDAGEALEGYPSIMMVDPVALPQQVADAKSRCDVLVVSMHWGVDYVDFPTERQQALAKLCIDNGADLILGHHPHVLQEMEIYKGKPIVYSMGGFVWDSSRDGADHSGIFAFELGDDSAEFVEMIPVEIRGCRPEPVEHGFDGE
ncbi:MAG: CapA family protein [bacterium]|nr:CapA family protein [bacterium]